MEEHDKDSNNMKGGGMDKRGVTRPMAEMQMHQHHSGMQHGGQPQQEGHQHENGEDHDMRMSEEMRKVA